LIRVLVVKWIVMGCVKIGLVVWVFWVNICREGEYLLGYFEFRSDVGWCFVVCYGVCFLRIVG